MATREIIHVYEVRWYKKGNWDYSKKKPFPPAMQSYDPPHWQVEYQVWDHAGKNLGSWTKVFEAQDEEGAKLKCVAHWQKLDKRIEKRRTKDANQKPNG